jgi:hypothetical protein
MRAEAIASATKAMRDRLKREFWYEARKGRLSNKERMQEIVRELAALRLRRP